MCERSVERQVLLGIDLGTSSVKALLLDTTGRVIGIEAEEYSILRPRPGYAEQDPEEWWEATCRAVRGVVKRAELHSFHIVGIGLSGQMHGMVLVDGSCSAVRNAIIWADQRSSAECELLRSLVGKSKLGQITGSDIAPGFAAASVLWMRGHERDVLDRAHLLLLPKDYIRSRMGADPCTDPTDASGTGLFDVSNRQWHEGIADAIGLRRSLLPPIKETLQIAGTVNRQAAGEMGVEPGIPIASGGGDQAMGAVGLGVIAPGAVSVTIGTGGQVGAVTDVRNVDPELRVHTFSFVVPDKWLLLGATLCAGLSLRWFRDMVACLPRVAEDGKLAYELLSEEAAEVPPGSDGLLFLPYLVGERTPHMNPRAAGVFFGLRLVHGRPHLTRAIMEGVAYALKDAFLVLRDMGATAESLVIAGGGARSPLWRQIISDVFGIPVVMRPLPEQAALGAALTAGIAVGVYGTLSEACDAISEPGETTAPCLTRREVYHENYERFRLLYRLLNNEFWACSKESGEGRLSRDDGH